MADLPDDHLCQVYVDEPPGYWHSHRCMRPAKHDIEDRQGNTRRVCGVHLRAHNNIALSEWKFQP